MENTAAAQPIVYSRKNPFSARLSTARLLTEGCSEKDTWHFEIELAGSGIQFEPGDSLAIFPTNCPRLAGDILDALGFSGDEIVTDADENQLSIRDALISACSITTPDKKFLKSIVEKAGAPAAEIAPLLESDKRKELTGYLWGREVIDFLLQFPQATFEPQEFVDTLKKLAVRLYSIASSLRVHPDEVHLTVATVKYQSFGRERKGVCSTFLAERIQPGTPVPCFISPGKGFRLPSPDDDTPVIMVGPGTGIAPFRAFLQERQATGARGKSWLYFGEIHESTCFLYGDEWKQYIADGLLHKLTTAFSRDQDHKIYVHHRMKEEAAELWRWLEEGAIVYVCGDAERMAVDVDKALHEVIATEGGKGVEGAAAYVDQMKKDKRYRRDVY